MHKNAICIAAITSAWMLSAFLACAYAEQPGSAAINLDLSSTSATETNRAHSSATIQVGQASKSVTASDLLTPAELVAVYQVVKAGHQSIILGEGGNAVGGSMQLGNWASHNLSSLNIPQGVTVFDLNHTLNIAGNVNNSGNLIATPTNGAIANITAINILNQQGAMISSILPAYSPVGLNIGSIDLTLAATQNILNYGTITSSGALNIRAEAVSNVLSGSGPAPIMQAFGSLDVRAFALSNQGIVNSVTGTTNLICDKLSNSGVIQSVLGALNISSLTGGLLEINNSAGRILANESLNITALAGANKPDLFVIGGVLQAANIDLVAVCGEVHAYTDEFRGPVNLTASDGYVSANQGNLQFAALNLTADPIFSLHGGGTLTLSNFAPGSKSDFVALSEGDIAFNTSGGTAINTFGGNATISAGYNFNVTQANPATCTTCTGFSITTPSKTVGNVNLSGIDISTVAAGQAGASPGFLTIKATGAVGTGKIDVYGTANAPWTSNGGDGGKVTITAGGGIGTGAISVYGGEITPSGGFDGYLAGGKGGSVTLTAGGVINTGDIDASAGFGSYFGQSGGTITLTAAKSIQSAAVNVTGGTAGPNGYGGGQGGSAGNITIQAGGALQLGNVLADGGGGYKANGGQVSLRADGDLTFANVTGLGGDGQGGGAGGFGANFIAVSGGTINGGNITSTGGGSFNGIGFGGPGGFVLLTAEKSIHAGVIVTDGGLGSDRGTALLSPGGKGGNAGVVILTAKSDVTATSISSRGGKGGDGGAGRDGGFGGDGGSVFVSAGGTLDTGSISASGGTGGHGGKFQNGWAFFTPSSSIGGSGGNGGSVFLTAQGTTTITGTVSANGGSGGNYNLDLQSQGGTGGFGGSAGNIIISTSTNSSISTLDLFAVGGDGGGHGDTTGGSDGTPRAGGNGGSVTITAGVNGNVSTRAISAVGGEGGADALGVRAASGLNNAVWVQGQAITVLGAVATGPFAGTSVSAGSITFLTGAGTTTPALIKVLPSTSPHAWSGGNQLSISNSLMATRGLTLMQSKSGNLDLSAVGFGNALSVQGDGTVSPLAVSDLFAGKGTFSSGGNDILLLAPGDIVASKAPSGASINASSASGPGGSIVIAAGTGAQSLSNGFLVVSAAPGGAGGSVKLGADSAPGTPNPVGLVTNTSQIFIQSYSGAGSVANTSIGSLNSSGALGLGQSGGNITVSAPGSVQTGVITANGSSGGVNGGNGGAITLVAGEKILASDILANGADGASGTVVGNGGNGANILLQSGTTVTLQHIIANGGNGGLNTAGGLFAGTGGNGGLGGSITVIASGEVITSGISINGGFGGNGSFNTYGHVGSFSIVPTSAPTRSIGGGLSSVSSGLKFSTTTTSLTQIQSSSIIATDSQRRSIGFGDSSSSSNGQGSLQLSTKHIVVPTTQALSVYVASDNSIEIAEQGTEVSEEEGELYLHQGRVIVNATSLERTVHTAQGNVVVNKNSTAMINVSVSGTVSAVSLNGHCNMLYRGEPETSVLLAPGEQLVDRSDADPDEEELICANGLEHGEFISAGIERRGRSIKKRSISVKQLISKDIMINGSLIHITGATSKQQKLFHKNLLEGAEKQGALRPIAFVQSSAHAMSKPPLYRINSEFDMGHRDKAFLVFEKATSMKTAFGSISFSKGSIMIAKQNADSNSFHLLNVHGSATVTAHDQRMVRSHVPGEELVICGNSKPRFDDGVARRNVHMLGQKASRTSIYSTEFSIMSLLSADEAARAAIQSDLKVKQKVLKNCAAVQMAIKHGPYNLSP